MGKAKVLIVHDDQDIRRLLAHRLKAESYETVFASADSVCQKPFEHETLLPAVRGARGDGRD